MRHPTLHPRLVLNKARTTAMAATLLAALAAGHGGPAGAAVQTVGNGRFTAVYDDSSRFGTLSLVGNALSFNLVSTAAPGTPWLAQSLDGAGSQAANATVTLRLRLDDDDYRAGLRFSAFDWLEGGDYFLGEAGSRVRVLGQLRAIDLARPLNTTTTDDLTVLSPGLGVVGSQANWMADARLDAGTPCGGAGCVNVFTTDAQTIQLQIENRLTATSAPLPGSQAEIEKKLGAAGAFTLVVSTVPEPASTALMAAGLVGVAAVARRRRGPAPRRQTPHAARLR